METQMYLFSGCGQGRRGRGEVDGCFLVGGQAAVHGGCEAGGGRGWVRVHRQQQLGLVAMLLLKVPRPPSENNRTSHTLGCDRRQVSLQQHLVQAWAHLEVLRWAGWYGCEVTFSSGRGGRPCRLRNSEMKGLWKPAVCCWCRCRCWSGCCCCWGGVACTISNCRKQIGQFSTARATKC